MEISEKIIEGISVYMLDGRVDSDGAVVLEKRLIEESQAGKNKMILDMIKVSYINSAGLRVLAEILTTNKENGGSLFLLSVNSKVQRVFKIIGFDNFFRMFNSLDEAVTAFKS